jgi:hypothetical protein
MKPEVNAVLQEVKASLAQQPQPPMPDFKTLSIMEATKWCMEHGIEKAPDIANLTGKKVNTIHTAQWKLRNPKRVKVLQRRAKKAKAKAKAGVANVVKTTKPKIENGRYDDGMETPMFDAIMRRGSSGFVKPRSLDLAKEWLAEKESNLEAENRRLKILVEHYETLLFKGGK